MSRCATLGCIGPCCVLLCFVVSSCAMLCHVVPRYFSVFCAMLPYIEPCWPCFPMLSYFYFCAILCFVLPCCALWCHVFQCSACHAVPCWTIIMLCFAMLCHVVPYWGILYCVVRCCVMMFCVVYCCPVLWCVGLLLCYVPRCIMAC